MSARKRSRARSRSRGISMIELLVAMSVMGVLTAMILTSWFVLQGSASSASQQSIQRDDARQALSRVATELRDAAGRLGNPAITVGAPNTITFSSTYNNAGNEDQAQVPHIVRYTYVPSEKAVYRVEDTDDDGSLAGEHSSLLVKNVVNATVTDEDGNISPVAMFAYSYYSDAGELQTITNPTQRSLFMGRVITVHIRMLVDVKPNKSPTFMDLATSVQPRNLRN